HFKAFRLGLYPAHARISDEHRMNGGFGPRSGHQPYSPQVTSDAFNERHREEADPGATSLPPDRQRPGDRLGGLPALPFRPHASRVACFLLVRFLSPDGARSATAP